MNKLKSLLLPKLDRLKTKVKAFFLPKWALFWHGVNQMFFALDQLANVFCWPFSVETWADETISSRCGRLGHRYPYRVYKFVIDVIFYWQEWDMNHCVRAYQKEKKRYQMPPEMR